MNKLWFNGFKKGNILMSVKNLKVSVALSLLVFGTYTSSSMAMELGFDIDDSVISENSRSRNGRVPEILILHCVGLSNEWVFENYGKTTKNGGAGVSAHYYIPHGGKIYQLVSEKESSFHAGVSEWRSSAKEKNLLGLNDISIGIEVQSSGYAQINGEGYYPYNFAAYDEKQEDYAILLSKQIMERNKISRENVVWHSDVSPLRKDSNGKILFGKTDPGPMFNGKKFAQAGVGVWPSSDRLEDKQLSTALEDIQTGLMMWGYPHVEKSGVFDDTTRYVLQAHYMHYLPETIWKSHENPEANLESNEGPVTIWRYHENQKAGSVFDTIKNWDEFPYDKETLSISLENLNRKNFAF
jgi:N-acetylmuramoyl-L-alanine amidase